MSVEFVVYCDHCGRLLDSSYRSVAAARRVSKEEMGAHVGRPGGRDVCKSCWDGGAR